MESTNLTQSQIDRIKKFKEILVEVEPSPVEVALGNFSQDANAEREISIWEGIAADYESKIAELQPTTQEEKMEIFKEILTESLMNPDTPVTLTKKS